MERLSAAVVVIAAVASEIEEVEEIAEGRAIEWHVGIIFVDYGVWEIVAAAMRQGLQVPIALDELQDRNVVGVAMADVASAGEGRNDNQRNARPVAKEVQGLNVAGVIVAAAFVEGDDQRGFSEKIGPGSQVVEGLLDHAFEEVEFGGRRMTINQAVRLDEGHGGRRFWLDGGQENRPLLVGRGPRVRVLHDWDGVQLAVADVAVGLSNQHERIFALRIVLERD